jgi:hypothetical protein
MVSGLPPPVSPALQVGQVWRQVDNVSEDTPVGTNPRIRIANLVHPSNLQVISRRREG